jgi:hypothetical protein
MEGRRVPVNGFGYISNKHLYDFMQDHQAIWDQREEFVRDMNPIIRNTIVERKRYESKREEIIDYYNEVQKSREQVAQRENTNWRQDVERDEGMVLDRLNGFQNQTG